MAGASDKKESDQMKQGVPLPKPHHNFRMCSGFRCGHQKQLRRKKPSHSHVPSNSSLFNSPGRPPADHRLGRAILGTPVPQKPLVAPPRMNVKDKSPISTYAAASGILEDNEKDSNNNEKNKEAGRVLLPRRSSSNVLNEGGNVGSSNLYRQERGLRSLLASDKGESEGSVQQRPSFSLTLSKEDTETDFLLMTGTLPTKRSKRKPKPVQEQLDGLFPGSLLTDVTSETYEVPDPRE